MPDHIHILFFLKNLKNNPFASPNGKEMEVSAPTNSVKNKILNLFSKESTQVMPFQLFFCKFLSHYYARIVL